MAPNDPRDDTLQHLADTWDTLPASLRPVHELLHDVSASWQRQLPSADALNAQLPLLLQDVAGERSPRQRRVTGAALRERRGGHIDGGGEVGRISGPVPQAAARRMHRWFSLVAALLLIALGASVFGVFAAHRPSPGTTAAHPTTTPTGTPTPTVPPITRVVATKPQNTRLPVPADAYFQGVSFSAAGDGWITGFTGVIGAEQVQLVHYHDGQWVAAHETFKYGVVGSVSMVSADEGWAIGVLTPETPPSLLHYTGGHWHNLGAFGLQDTNVGDLHMSASGWGYAVGEATVPVPGQSYTTQVLAISVYQAGTWQVIQTSIQPCIGCAVMISPDEGWVVGRDLQSNGALGFYHYTHGSWSRALLVNDDAFPKATLDSLSMASPQDMWASGTACSPPGLPVMCHPLIYHFDGARWVPVTPPDTSSINWNHYLAGMQVFSDETGAAWLSFATQDNALPSPQYELVLYRYAHGQWIPETLPVAHVILISFASDHNGGTWAVGATQNPYASYVFYTQGDGAWRVYGHT